MVASSCWVLFSCCIGILTVAQHQATFASSCSCSGLPRICLHSSFKSCRSKTRTSKIFSWLWTWSHYISTPTHCKPNFVFCKKCAQSKLGCLGHLLELFLICVLFVYFLHCVNHNFTLFLQPVKMMDDFLRLASQNTRKNLETCGVLAGSLVRAVEILCTFRFKKIYWVLILTVICACNLVALEKQGFSDHNTYNPKAGINFRLGKKIQFSVLNNYIHH